MLLKNRIQSRLNSANELNLSPGRRRKKICLRAEPGWKSRVTEKVTMLRIGGQHAFGLSHIGDKCGVLPEAQCFLETEYAKPVR
jgi:hypothetical protein